MESPISNLQVYVDASKPILRLTDWTIVCADAAPSAESSVGAFAETSAEAPAKRALLEFYPSFWEQTREAQRQTVVHELLHLHLKRYARHGDYLEPHLMAPVWHLWKTASHNDLEILCDTLADVIAPWLPLPPWIGGSLSV